MEALKPLVILVGADKGGVGKTVTARTFADYLDFLRVPAKLFDTEFPAGDLRRFALADVIDIANVRDQMRVFDALAGVTVVDIRAGLLSPTLRALDEAKLLDDVRNGSLTLALLHVLGPTVSSLSEIAEAATTIGQGAKHFIVKNHVNEGGFAEWESDGRFAEHFKALEKNTIKIGHLDAAACDEVQKRAISFAAFANENPPKSRILSGKVRGWLDRTFAEFDKVGIGRLVAEAVGEATAKEA